MPMGLPIRLLTGSARLNTQHLCEMDLSDSRFTKSPKKWCASSAPDTIQIYSMSETDTQPGLEAFAAVGKIAPIRHSMGTPVSVRRHYADYQYINLRS